MLTVKKGIILFSLAVSTVLYGAEAPNIKEKIQNIDFIKNVGFVVKEVKEVGDIYAINATHPRSAKVTLFVSKDLKAVVIGQGFKANGEPIDFPINMEQYKKDAIYTIGQGKIEYYLFTDPECPYCQKFEQMATQLKEDVKIHVLFFPLDFHKNAQQMCKFILNQKGNEARAKAMHDIAEGKEDYKNLKLSDKDSSKYQEIIDKHLKIGREIGVNGTPAVYDATGKPIQWPELLKK
ncbi:thioredoxin fold domain-containing protein [Sulfurospirillum multivorans]|uniref:Thioredoxin-like fold domain-containing protein n=2 Tax=Sulfurospirillum multivorans TaxID=66821 RepID=A0AA86ALU6_SULMK|nr:thioredoxin fold domain-containing protein [Sulfurospirillum multivorans]AHJ13006.1 hypothetical protein SMUL_1751 [Sulfurospirillum multivorans DSM 12446]QEH06497.1 hypothetical protein SMN_1732 [Sulfurospirillum multivorans]